MLQSTATELNSSCICFVVKAFHSIPSVLGLDVIEPKYSLKDCAESMIVFIALVLSNFIDGRNPRLRVDVHQRHAERKPGEASVEQTQTRNPVKN